MRNRHRLLLPPLVALALITASAPGLAASQASEPGWKHALRVRSEALNRANGLGSTAQAADSGWRRALHLRSEALDRT